MPTPMTTIPTFLRSNPAVSVGTLITITPDAVIVKREPIWPFPASGLFPRRNADNTITYFFPRPYYEFHLHSRLDTTHLQEIPNA